VGRRIGSWLALSFSGAAALFFASEAPGGPVLPVQANLTINELATLVVTNTATETNAPAAGALTNTYIFTYANRSALLTDGWSFIATYPSGAPRDTEVTSGAVVSYDQSAHPGVLRIPCDVGDLWGSVNTSRNSLFRNLSSNWTTVQLALSFAPTVDYQQVHLAVYQDDDNYIQGGLAHNNALGGEVTTLIWEHKGQPSHYFTTLNSVNSIRLRLDHDLVAGSITHLYSLNGVSWNVLGTTSQTLVNPRLGIWVGGSPVPWTEGLASCDLQRLDVVVASGAPLVLTYSLVNPPAGAVIDANGVITWTPSDAQGPGTNVFTTVVTDNAQPPSSATNSFAIVINEVNTAPVLPAQPDVTLSLPATLTLTNTATDTDDPPNLLTYQLLVAPTNAVIDANGVITWTPSPAQAPSTNLFVTVVTDSNPLAANAQHLSATNSFTVVALEPPWPVLPAQTDRVVGGLTTLWVTNTATDSRVSVSQVLTHTFLFSYLNRAALLADGWSFVGTSPGGAARDTEITSGAVASYDQASHPGILRIPCDLGDLWGSANNTRNSLFHSLPAGWTSLQVALSFTATSNYHQAHLGLYQDDDNYLQVGLAYNSGRGLTMDLETGRRPNAFVRRPTSATDLRFRLDRDPANGSVAGYYSLDGTNWTLLGTTNQDFVNPRLALWTGSYGIPYTASSPVMDLRQLDISALTNVPTVLTYRLVDAPPGASIDDNGVITWTPAEAQVPSTNTITTVVTDNGVPSLSATNSFTVVVNAIHNGPVLPPQSNLTIEQYATLTVTNTALETDIPLPDLTYSLIGAPAGSAIDTNGIITWTPGAGQGHTTNTMTAVVTDNGVPPLSATNSFTVVVDEINVAPVLPGQADWTLAGQQSLIVTNTASAQDMPTVTLTYELTGPTGAVIDTNGVIAWTPAAEQVPSTNVFLTVVTDYNPWAVNAQYLSATNTFTVVVNPIRYGPVLPAQIDLTVDQYATLMVTNTALDTDLPVPGLIYSLAGAPAGATVNANGVILWTPGAGQGDTTNTITTVVIDPALPPLSATNSFTVVVNEINVAPVLPAQTDRNLFGQQALIVTNTATEPDMPPATLTYQLSGPAGAVIDTYGVIKWTPSVAQVPSTNVLTTVVTDYNPRAVNAQYLNATNSFTVVVNAIHNGPVLPPQSNLTIDQYATLAVTNTAFDLDLPPPVLTYGLVDAPDGAVIDSNGIITWTPTEWQSPSTNTITTVVTDEGVPSLSATNSFAVVVLGPPPPFQIASIVVSSNAVLVTWGAVAGRTYRLQFKGDPGQADWEDVLPDVLASGPTASMTNGLSGSAWRFYRVMLRN
jgi:hypothetical protein